MDYLTWNIDFAQHFDISDYAPIPVFEDSLGTISLLNDEESATIEGDNNMNTSISLNFLNMYSVRIKWPTVSPSV